jgi:Flp pilus assembly protein TadG
MVARGGTGDRSRGQGLVEFSLAIPIFLMVLLGLVDMGRLVFSDSIISQAAREGARLASVEASWLGSSDSSCGTPNGPVCPADATVLQAHVTAAASRMVAGLAGTITNVYIRCDPPGSEPTGAWTGVSCANRTQGNVVSVRIAYTYNPITPMVGPLIGSQTRFGASSMVSN